ncbi:MAG: carboxypeptidase-like regulatory domain-containing protein [Bacteroidetes bacterium]|nr:MAG: carboxypeptidase-like regulatory domain-containing protein [Bacteroidota bacterium]
MMRRLTAVIPVLILFILPLIMTGQTVVPFTIVKGVVTDAETGEPLPFVNILADGSKAMGTTTDFSGQFVLQNLEPFTKIRVSYLGYKTQTKTVQAYKTQNFNFKLQRETKELKEVTIKAGKRRYRNKDNPAVQLIQLVIDHKDENRKDAVDAYEVEKYEKVQFALSNITEKFKNRKFLKKFQFIFENIDTTSLKGKEILPVYLTETISELYYRKDPKANKELVQGTRKVNFDKYFDNQGISKFIQYLIQEIDIYKNNITILTNQFVSPISDIAPTFYRYYILDTLMIDTTRCIKLGFFPRNKSDFLLQGDLYITLDSNYAVRRNEMAVSPDINLNFVKELKIAQDYKQAKAGEWMLNTDEIAIDFGVGANGLGLFGQRSVSYKDYIIGEPKEESFYKEIVEFIPDSISDRGDKFWDDSRHLELTKSEAGVIAMMDTIQKIPAFRRAMNLMILLVAGYRDIGGFEIGPVNTFYNYNPIEGVRVRLGGRTTQDFSKRLNLEMYGAYAFLDDRWKYYAGATYALKKNYKYNEWPLKTMKLSYQDDTKIPGQELQFVQEDNVLLSFKRGENTKLLYNKIFNLEYLNEFRNHFSVGLGFKRWEQSAAGSLYFNPVVYNDFPQTEIPSLTTSEVIVNLRYAPHEQFYQGKTYRIPMFNRYPIFSLRVAAGFKGLAGGEQDYQNISFSVMKRFYPSPIGYTDMFLEYGQIFGTVPYPLLSIHRANQTYSYQLQSYNLMNFLEFVSDRYVAFNIDHYFNGFIFNKLPLLKKLKLREVVTMKVLYGGISDKNLPENNASLYKFPLTNDGQTLTHSLEKKPYIEASIGIANIFKLFRIDLIRRFSYLEHPGVDEIGIRGRFKFDF